MSSGRPSSCWTLMTLRFGLGRGGHDPVRPIIVTDTVLDDQLGGRDLLATFGLTSKLCGSVWDRSRSPHLDIRAADLRDDVGIFVFHADNIDDLGSRQHGLKRRNRRPTRSRPQQRRQVVSFWLSDVLVVSKQRNSLRVSRPPFLRAQSERCADANRATPISSSRGTFRSLRVARPWEGRGR